MTEDDDFQLFDRAILVKNEEIKSFLADPEGYLRGKGALDGLPEFNGVTVADKKTLDGVAVAPYGLLVTHHPAPWIDRCSWHATWQDP